MRRIKICGLTRPTDVEHCCRLGADLLGFVVAASPRQVSLEALKTLVAPVPASILTVAVSVDPTRSEADRLLEVVDRIQLHGHEQPQFCKRYGRRAVKAFRVRGPEDVRDLEAYKGTVGALLLDSYQKGVAGGTGHVFSWDLLAGKTFSVPTFLAGGLEVGNLAQAWKVEATDGFDLSSGVETSPGVKDPEKLNEFFALFERLRGSHSCKH